MSPAEETVTDQTVGAGFSQDTLTKADKLDVTYVGSLTETTAALPVKRIETFQPALRRTANRSSLRPLHPNAKRIAGILPRPRPKIRLANNDSSAGASADCAQPNGSGSIVTWFNGWLRCGS